MKIVALIPARAGSKRVKGKNIRPLGGKPLITWTIEAALESEVFSRVLVSSDDEETLRIAGKTGALGVMRRKDLANDGTPDVPWVKHMMAQLQSDIDAFAILRPTSPFRSAQTIRAAYDLFVTMPVHMDSVRAVRLVTEHPGKMWFVTDPGVMRPVLDRVYDGVPWHSSPTQTLPPYYVQTGGLEMAWRRVLKETDTISGHYVAPFVLAGFEALDINTEDDWSRAEQCLSTAA